MRRRAAAAAWLCQCSVVCALAAPRLARRHVLHGAAASAAWPRLASAAADPTAVTLSNGQRFPLASFGLQVYDDETAERLTALALQTGFRNFFASVLAGNQRGFARAVGTSSVPRDELFICGSVVSNRAVGFETAYKLTQLGCRENMEAFGWGGIRKLDMILLDYPGPDDESILGQWRAFEEMREAGLVSSLAVSNFTPRQLDVILGSGTKHRPVLNQLPMCVGYHDAGFVPSNRRRGVHVQAWSPLGSGRLARFSKDAAVAKAVCADVGAAHGKTAAQVALRWLVQTGASFTVESKSAVHMREDLAVFDFELSGAEMARLEEFNAQPEREGSITQG